MSEVNDGLPTLFAPFTTPPPQSREAAYMEKAEAKHHDKRERRLRRLRTHATRSAIQRATGRLTELAHPSRDYIAIRSAFIYGRRLPPTTCPDGADQFVTPPPLTDLLSHKNQHAIALYLTMLFVRQMEAAGIPDDRRDRVAVRRQRSGVYNPAHGYSEASLIGLPSTNRRNQRRVLARTLDALHVAELVDLDDDGRRYVNRKLNREDGSGNPYAVPDADPTSFDYLCLPTQFFTAGWPMILSPSELATFLGICHYADRSLPPNPDGDTLRRVYLAKSLREEELGLSDEAYESIHELAEFGLIEIVDTVEGRRRGRIPPHLTPGNHPDPYKLIPTVLGGFRSWNRMFNLDAFDQPAIDTAIECLQRPLPRYAELAGTSRDRPAGEQVIEARTGGRLP